MAEKIVIATDIHGSFYYGEKVVKAFEREKADVLVLLGDFYYHGPRNPLPEGHAPMALYELLNGIKDKIYAVRGNCDANIDLTVSEFEFHDDGVFTVGKNKLWLAHGDKFSTYTVPEVDGVIFGHFHTNEWSEKDGKKYFGLSSVSLPKNGSERAYIVIENGVLTLKNLDGETLKTAKL